MPRSVTPFDSVGAPSTAMTSSGEDSEEGSFHARTL
jgi:hypothetical protein